MHGQGTKEVSSQWVVLVTVIKRVEQEILPLGQNPLSRNPNRAPDKYPMNHHPGAAVSLGSANSRKDGALYLASSHPDAIGQLSPFLVRPPSHCCSSVILSPGSPEIHSTSNQMLLLQGRQPKQPNRYLMILPAQQYSSFFVFVFVFAS